MKHTYLMIAAVSFFSHLSLAEPILIKDLTQCVGTSVVIPTGSVESNDGRYYKIEKDKLYVITPSKKGWSKLPSKEFSSEIGFCAHTKLGRQEMRRLTREDEGLCLKNRSNFEKATDADAEKALLETVKRYQSLVIEWLPKTHMMTSGEPHSDDTREVLRAARNIDQCGNILTSNSEIKDIIQKTKLVSKDLIARYKRSIPNMPGFEYYDPSKPNPAKQAPESAR